MNFLHLIEVLYSIGFLAFLIATRFALKSKRMLDKKIIELTGLTNDLRAAIKSRVRPLSGIGSNGDYPD